MKARLWGPLTASLALALSPACTSECETNRDCPSGAFRCIDNRCVPPDNTPLPDLGFAEQFDIGFPDVPDRGFPDRGFRDLGFPPPPDTGVDGGPVDAADSGDTGVPTDPPTDTEALVQVGVMITNFDGGPPLAEARFFDFTANGRQVESRTEGGCTLTEVAPPGSGMPVGLSADRIVISNGPSVILVPDPMNPGLFEKQGQVDPEDLIESGTTISYEIFSTGVSGTLDGATASTGLPDPPIQQPFSAFTLGFAEVNLLPFLTVTPIRGEYRFDMYNEERTKVAECPISASPGGLPAFLATFFQGLQVTLEVRNDSDSVVNVPVVGGGTIPVTFRATRGFRYTVNVP